MLVAPKRTINHKMRLPLNIKVYGSWCTTPGMWSPMCFIVARAKPWRCDLSILSLQWTCM